MEITDPAAEALADLWTAFQAERSEALRHRLVLQYSPLVKYVVGRVRAGMPASVDAADLVSEGVIGLMDAVDRFEPDRGLQFQTFAVPRIRGAILDAVRASDWVPRSVRSRLRAVEEARTALRDRLGREPEHAELARACDLTVAELRDLLDRPTGVGAAADGELEEVAESGPELGEALEDDATRATLLAAVRDLPERDQVVLALYFFEGFTLAEIGRVLDVTESRASQLRTRAIASLRTRLAG